MNELEKKILKDKLDKNWGLKIYADSSCNQVDSKMILGIINELTMIHNAIVQDNLFMAGAGLGRLQGDLVILMEQLEELEHLHRQ